VSVDAEDDIRFKLFLHCTADDERLTDTTPQVNALIMKHDSTQTQPYPPSGGGFISTSPTSLTFILASSLSQVAVELEHRSIACAAFSTSI